MKTFLKFISYSFLAVVGIFVVVFLYIFLKGLITPDTPEQRQRKELRATIEVCWNDYNRKSVDESTKRFIASTCEKLEDDLRKR